MYEFEDRIELLNELLQYEMDFAFAEVNSISVNECLTVEVQL
jgi:hypothetical protein